MEKINGIGKLKQLNTLLVEDDETIKNALEVTLKKIFNVVYTANDGQKGLDTFKENENDIDIILTDIKMPNKNGLEMIREIREFNDKVPIIIQSAESDVGQIIEAIKYRIHWFALKPINMAELIQNMSEACKKIFEERLIERQKKEIKQYVDIIDQFAIISKTDKDGIITFVNESFCEVSKYEEEELLGRKHNILRHEDMSGIVFEKLWNTIKSGETFKGKIKNKAKDGSFYWVNANIFPLFDDEGEIEEFMAVRYLVTEEEEEKKSFRSKIRTTILDEKVSNTKHKKLIDDLNSEIEGYKKQLEKINLGTEFGINKDFSEIAKERLKKIDELEIEIKSGEQKFLKLLKKYRQDITKIGDGNKILGKELISMNKKYEVLESKYEKLNESKISKTANIIELNKRVSELSDIIKVQDEMIIKLKK